MPPGGGREGAGSVVSTGPGTAMPAAAFVESRRHGNARSGRSVGALPPHSEDLWVLCVSPHHPGGGCAGGGLMGGRSVIQGRVCIQKITIS